MSIAEFSTKSVITALESNTVLDAAKLMSERGVGSIVVVDPDKKPIGIVTDRDIVLKAVLRGKDPKLTILKEIMTKELIILSQDRGFFETTRIMSDMGIRRIPIVDHDGKLTGIISLDDLILVFGEELTNIANAIASGTSTPKGVKTPVG